jgi:hypothetical protein
MASKSFHALSAESPRNKRRYKKEAMPAPLLLTARWQSPRTFSGDGGGAALAKVARDSARVFALLAKRLAFRASAKRSSRAARQRNRSGALIAPYGTKWYPRRRSLMGRRFSYQRLHCCTFGAVGAIKAPLLSDALFHSELTFTDHSIIRSLREGGGGTRAESRATFAGDFCPGCGAGTGFWGSGTPWDG